MTYAGRLATWLGALAAATILTGCGGGGNPDPIDTNDGGTLNGQLVQAGGVKVTSAEGDGLSGIDVKLISKGNGAVVGRATTDSGGRFQFMELPNGSYLIHINFTEAVDFDLDAASDEIDLFFPVDIAEDAITELIQELEAADTDGDSQPDSINVHIRISDDKGKNQETMQQHRRRHGQLRIDNDRDGNITDDDDTFDDDDADGLPDDDRFQGPRGPKLKGDIEAISDTSITVDGQTFVITDATKFRSRGNSGAAADFEVGDEVQVTSFTNNLGEQVAVEIKLKKNHSGGGEDDDEIEIEGEIEALTDTTITVGGQTFTLSANTLFFINGGEIGTIDDFEVGDNVELKAVLIGDVWTVLRLKLEDDDDDDDEMEVTGEITALSDTSITVNGQTFTLNAETGFFLSGNDPGVLADFEVGDTVELKAELVDGVWVVTRLKMEDDQRVELRGTIASLTATTVTIDGQVYYFDAGTQFFVEGNDPGTIDDFDAGDEVELKADFENGQFFVSRLKLETDDNEEDERTVTGAIEAIADGSVTIGGEEFTLDAETDFLFSDDTEATFEDFAAGADVTLVADLESGVWVVRSLQFNTDPVELGDFTLSFTEMTPHIGQNLYLKVVDTETNTTVSTAPVTMLTMAEFDITIPDILEDGKEYNVDFWADVDASGTLDGTPIGDPVGVDHAWRLTETADGDGLSLSFVHNTDFVDIRPF
jgi:hypothetical protein